MAEQYVLLRMGNLRGVDLSIFEVDYDLNWHGLILTPDGQVLGRFGGRDAETPGKYQTLPGLRHALEQNLKRFRAGAYPKPMARMPMYAEDYPAADRRPANACIHCHHVYEFQRDYSQSKQQWSVDQVWVYPQPTNIGLTIDVDEGNRVVAVAPNSAAARLGIRAKDVLTSINGRAVASIMDVQHALHKAPAAGKVAIEWHDGSQALQGSIPLAEGWKRTDVSWRWSLKSLAPDPSIIGDDLDATSRMKLGLSATQLAYRHMNFLTPAGRHAGLRTGDIIVGIDNQKLQMNARQFETHIRLHYRVGQEVTLNVLRGDERVNLKLKLPE